MNYLSIAAIAGALFLTVSPVISFADDDAADRAERMQNPADRAEDAAERQGHRAAAATRRHAHNVHNGAERAEDRIEEGAERAGDKLHQGADEVKEHVDPN